MSEEPISSFANYYNDIHLNSDSLEFMTREISKNGASRKNFIQKAEMGMIRDFFSKKGYIVDINETGKRLNEIYHIEVINPKFNGRDQ